MYSTTMAGGRTTPAPPVWGCRAKAAANSTASPAHHLNHDFAIELKLAMAAAQVVLHYQEAR